MAASRYSTGAEADAKPNSTTSTSGGTSTTSPTSTSTSTNSTAVKDINSSTNTTNMSPANLAALNTLIQQLLGGGTANQKQDRAVKTNEIGTLQQQRAGYSKDAAFSDAKGLMAQQMRLTLEKLLPGINSASLGAGASQSSMRALLTQRAAENAAENASAAGLGAAVNYGQVSNGISSVLANLIAQQDPATAALINALSVAKGAVSNSKTTGTETTNTSGQQSQTSSGGTVTTSPTTTSVNYSQPGSLAPMTSGQQSGLTFFAPLQTDESIALNNLKYIGTTRDTLDQLLGNDSWGGYTF